MGSRAARPYRWRQARADSWLRPWLLRVRDHSLRAAAAGHNMPSESSRQRRPTWSKQLPAPAAWCATLYPRRFRRNPGTPHGRMERMSHTPHNARTFASLHAKRGSDRAQSRTARANRTRHFASLPESVGASVAASVAPASPVSVSRASCTEPSRIPASLSPI